MSLSKSHLSELHNDSQLCDVTLKVEGTRINAHRVVLSASSRYFKAMFTSDMAESRMSVFVKTVVSKRIRRNGFPCGYCHIGGFEGQERVV
ncbi:BTB/POZ domain protein, partial [Cooperia oncophora]